MHANNRKYTQTNYSQGQHELAAKELNKVTRVIPANEWQGSSDFIFFSGLYQLSF